MEYTGMDCTTKLLRGSLVHPMKRVWMSLSLVHTLSLISVKRVLLLRPAKLGSPKLRSRQSTCLTPNNLVILLDDATGTSFNKQIADFEKLMEKKAVVCEKQMRDVRPDRSTLETMNKTRILRALKKSRNALCTD
ncbi:conserved hypothetical protein [Ricinus communis]|uniref:Uncharacterized protein n=1 Tax=Ricinus communis TaxID=3988 RepID=B9T1P1_RICCO|nr:conserved hypothetical protein [Ricinus communis]